MQKNNNILGLDIGSARVGVAIVSGGLMIPRALSTLENNDQMETQLKAIVSSQNISTVVVGLPRNLNGDDTAQTTAVRDIAADLGQKLGVSIHFQDEALTSKNAELLLKKSGQPYNKGDIDSLAACQILSDYIEQEVRK